MNHDQDIQLTDLKSAWASLEQRLETDFDKVERLALELAADKTRSLARRAMLPPMVDLLVQGAGLAIVIGGFSQGGSAVYVTCLMACGAVLLTLMIAAAAQIAMLAGLDPAAPVLATQLRLGRVRAWRIFEWKWVLLLSPVLWGPFFVVAVELPLKLASGNGAELTLFSAGYVWANLIIGALLTLALLRLSDWAARRFAGSDFLRTFLNDLAGRRLTAAQAFLQRLNAFERR